MMRNVSPCTNCTKVVNPENCENKSCIPWQKWFLARWELIRAYPRYHMENAPLQQPGIVVGGRKYTHPDAVRQFSAKSPCAKCHCPEDLCTAPCPARVAWDRRSGVISS